MALVAAACRKSISNYSRFLIRPLQRHVRPSHISHSYIWFNLLLFIIKTHIPHIHKQLASEHEQMLIKFATKNSKINAAINLCRENEFGSTMSQQACYVRVDVDRIAIHLRLIKKNVFRKKQKSRKCVNAIIIKRRRS